MQIASVFAFIMFPPCFLLHICYTIILYHFILVIYTLYSLVCYRVCGSEPANPECHGWWHKVIKCATPLFFHGCQGNPLVTLAGTHAMGTSLVLCGGLSCRVVGGPMCSHLIVNISFHLVSNIFFQWFIISGTNIMEPSGAKLFYL